MHTIGLRLLLATAWHGSPSHALGGDRGRRRAGRADLPRRGRAHRQGSRCGRPHGSGDRRKRPRRARRQRTRPDARRLRALPFRFLRGSQPRQPARSTGLRARAAAFPANDAGYLRVKVNGQTVLQELGAADNDNGAWATANVNLNAFAGQAVTITVEAADLSTASLVG